MAAQEPAVKAEAELPEKDGGRVNFRKLDAQGKASRLQQRAREVKLKSQKKEIGAVMDEHPEVVPQIADYLVSLGYALVDGKGQAGGARRAAPANSDGAAPDEAKAEPADEEEG